MSMIPSFTALKKMSVTCWYYITDFYVHLSTVF